MPTDHENGFYGDRGDGSFDSAELTRGPWDGAHQHAGPPAALIGRAIERCEGVGGNVAGRIVGRVTFEILRPIPIAPVVVSAGVTRPGRRVDMVEASLSDAEGTELVRARGWRLARSEVELPDRLGSVEDGPARAAGRPSGATGMPAPPDELPVSNVDFFPTGYDVGYHSAMEYRAAVGAFMEPGPAAVWLRMRHPLIAGEEPTPLQRVLVAADTGNGISSTLDFRRYLFINVDLTVHLHREPDGEWVCLDALTIPEPTGVGMTDTQLRDVHGPIGRAAQTLLVAERSAG